MKILIYNYVQPHERNSPGGGVSVYLRNLIDGLKDAGNDVYVLSSGDRYDVFNRKPRLKIDDGRKELIIFNSPNVAPSYFSFYHTDIFFESALLDRIPALIKDALGHFDVFHFHNIEGLTLGFFRSLRNVYQDSAIIYSAHNYSTVCAQVNLWRNKTGACDNYNDGQACIDCLDRKDLRTKKILVNIAKTPIKNLSDSNSPLVRQAYAIESMISKRAQQSRAAYMKKSPAAEPSKQSAPSIDPSNFVKFRQTNVSLMNSCFDRTLAVSQRTKDILVKMGVRASNVEVSYIGTRHFDKLAHAHRKVPQPGNMHLGFLGYMTPQKGFYFFLEILEGIPDEVIANIDVTIAARFTDIDALARLDAIELRARSLQKFDGFSHNNIERILEPVTLGIVPPLWEDNLPQVAIEFVTHGIPILTSNRGGAGEIASLSDFVFDTASIDDAVSKLLAMSDGSFDASHFWDRDLNIHSISSHTNNIIRLYQDCLFAKNPANQ